LIAKGAALPEYLAHDGAVIMEPEAGVYDYKAGKRRREAGMLPEHAGNVK